MKTHCINAQTNPFAGKNLRCMYDEMEQKWWFSAVDICAMLTDSDYESARLYWKTCKRNFSAEGNQLVAICHRLKMPSSDGRYRYTEVLDIRQVIYLIQAIPSPKAETYRMWLADMAAIHAPMERILVATGAQKAALIRDAYMHDPQKLSERLTIMEEDIV